MTRSAPLSPYAARPLVAGLLKRPHELSACRRRGSPRQDHALRISVLGEEPDLVVVQRQRVGIEVLGLCSRCPQSPRGVPEVREGLALHLPLVPPEPPVAKVEGLVREN